MSYLLAAVTLAGVLFAAARRPPGSVRSITIAGLVGISVLALVPLECSAAAAQGPGPSRTTCRTALHPLIADVDVAVSSGTLLLMLAVGAVDIGRRRDSRARRGRR